MKYQQGKFNPLNEDKYIGDPTKIRYLSSWERHLMKYLDTHKDVLRWNSEDFIVPYISPLDGKKHRYLVDFFVELNTKNGIQKRAIEVKPRAETKAPRMGKNLKSYERKMKTYIVNKAKWIAASAYCKDRGVQFMIMTEYDLGLKK